MKKHLLFVLLLIPYFSYSQLAVSISTPDIQPIYPADGDTLSVCRNSEITFVGEATSGGSPVTGATYKWSSVGNSSAINNSSTQTYSFNEGGGYRVKLTVVKGTEEAYDILPVKIAFPPDYSATKTDIPTDQNGICKGSTVNLTGKAVPVLWEDEPVYKVTEAGAIGFSDTQTYGSTLPFDEFLVGETFDGGDDIDSIGINFEHTDMGQVQVKLTCPNGSSIILKDYDNTNHSDLGDPVNDLGYNYFWSTGAVSGLMNTHSAALEAAYEPQESYAGLNGCPLNGDWKIEISDNTANDEGSVLSWTIIFAEEVLPEIWTFKDTLKNYYNHPTDGFLGTYWSSEENISATNTQFSGDTIIGNATANPSPSYYGNIPYKYNVVNNWGCPQDTIINIRIEEPDFSFEPASDIMANTDLVEFDSPTTWVSLYDWSFGDGSENSSDETPEHLYLEKGDYSVFLTVYDESGCYDTVRHEITIIVETSKLPIPNVFSPNGDGTNDNFKLKFPGGSEESEGSGNKLTGMKEFRIDIYNRWGEKMYTCNSQEEAADIGWDGTMLTSKIKASPGIYFFVIKAKGKDDVEYKEKGSLYLFRD
ncbi:MAG: hypothetical protein GY750_14515 [Lentisphaerae bacterium]|nr:hypothetical protein [Lentisphaerota bacterium]